MPHIAIGAHFDACLKLTKSSFVLGRAPVHFLRDILCLSAGSTSCLIRDEVTICMDSENKLRGNIIMFALQTWNYIEKSRLANYSGIV